MTGNQLPSINHIVQLMLENRSFDHTLGFLYAPLGVRGQAPRPVRQKTLNVPNGPDGYGPDLASGSSAEPTPRKT